jgi:hypothetical protein
MTAAQRYGGRAYHQRGTAMTIKLIFNWPFAYLKKLACSAMDKPVEFLTLIVAAFSVGILVWQLSELNDNLESQAYSYIIASQTELDKVIIEYSEYREYFTQNVALDSASPEKRPKILSLADQRLDFIDSTYQQLSHINSNHYTRKAWEAYFEQSFKCSVVLRDLYCSEGGQYGNKLANFLARTFPAGMCDGNVSKPLSLGNYHCSD